MCIAIVKPSKAHISDDRLGICFENNPDGAGFAYYNEKGFLVIRKGYFKFNKFLKAYKRVCENRRMLIHFRIKTVGDANHHNCHPFEIGCNSAMIHNGTMTSVTPEKGFSDSRTLAKWIQETNEHSPGALFTKAGINILESLAKPSRVAFMTPAKFILLSPASWKLDDGVYYSNEGFKEVKKPATVIPYKGKEQNYQQSLHERMGSALPLDCSKKDSPSWHQFHGVCSLNHPPGKIYEFWTSLPQASRDALLKSRNINERPHGINMHPIVNDLFGSKYMSALNYTEEFMTKRVLVKWLADQSLGTEILLEKMTMMDLLVLVGMRGYAASECLEDLHKKGLCLDIRAKIKA